MLFQRLITVLSLLFLAASLSFAQSPFQAFINPCEKCNFYQQAIIKYEEKKSGKEQYSAQHYYSLSRNRVTQINKVSELIPDSKTGVIDAQGYYIQEADDRFGLNCSGYAKWIADGYYHPLVKNSKTRSSYLSIQRLRKKWPLLRAYENEFKYEDSREPFFGLDWARNIANQVEGAKLKKNFLYNSHDVRHSLSYTYEADRGFPIEKLPEIIKEETLIHPERWYIVAINGPYGNPQIIQNYHIAVIFSYYHIYMGKMTFRFHVFERTRQTSFEYLAARYPGTYCNLIYLTNEGKFELTLP
ncbi:MAG: hypothetical protein K5839_01475 [Treponemataceae bacterium]|nr:hypothetical protein [Treponemataceae bacterium]